MRRSCRAVTCFLVVAWAWQHAAPGCADLGRLAALRAAEQEAYAIRVIDEETGRGVPLVELTTVHDLRYVTDSAGLVAFHEPGLMNQKVFFQIASHGYEFPKDGFGFRGQGLDVAPGGSATLKIRRLNLAERLYRITGGGLYADSIVLGRTTPVDEPLLNARVLGQDSVRNALYQGRLFWIWGDTNRPAYPLGNFQVSGATSRLPHRGGLDPSVGVDLDYFVDGQGFAKELARMPGPGPTWIDSLVTVTPTRHEPSESPNRDNPPRERLYASFVKVKPPLEVYERGLAKFDDAAQRFERVRGIDLQERLVPQGHALQHATADGDHLYFGDPHPHVRVVADEPSFLDLSRYEGFTCLTSAAPEAVEVERDAAGSVVWKWRRGIPPIDEATEERLIRAGTLRADESWLGMRDAAHAKRVKVHRGSVSWNPYRGKWIMIFTESGGATSLLGEVWYSESEQLEGPYHLAVKVASHDRYSFYNPKQHPYFSQEGGRFIYFEGTYTRTFSGNPLPTPRYEYNQIMYRLDLADPRLKFAPQKAD